MIKNASQWILEYSQINFLDSFMVQGFEFELMSLSKENIEAARVLASSKDIIELARSLQRETKTGLQGQRERISCIDPKSVDFLSKKGIQNNADLNKHSIPPFSTILYLC